MFVDSIEERINRVYCRGHVDNFELKDKVIKSFADIVDKDSPGKTFGFSDDILSMRCVDMDCVEKLIFEAKQDETMDCMVGIGLFSIERREIIKRRMLLVELKMNSRRHNLKASDYIGKIKHTRNLLMGKDLHPNHVFLFADGVRGKAKSDVANWRRGSNGKILRSVLVKSPEEFNDYIGFESQYPYIPENSEVGIRSSIMSVSSDIDALSHSIEEWKKLMEEYRYRRNNSQEAEHILKTVRAVVSEIKDSFADGFEREYLILILGELG